MSQVIRKFENSGKIEQSKPELFERSGVGKYNKADLVAGLYRNIDTYIKHNNLSGDRAVSFRNYANQFIKGIENGTISMNGDGTFSDSTGNLASTGKFDTTWTGHKKDTANNAMNLVGHYALDYINQMQQYIEPVAKPKGKFNIHDLLTKEISKRWYGGRDIDYNNWFKNRNEKDRNALLGEILNNVDYNQIYQDYNWTDTGINSMEDLANRGRAFGAAISNNVIDNDDYNTFAALGGNGLDKFLKETPVKSESTTEQRNKIKAWEAEAEASGAKTPEAKALYVQNKQEEEAEINNESIKESKQQIYNRQRKAFFDDYATNNPFKGTINGYVADKVAYDPEKTIKHIDTHYKGNINDYFRKTFDPGFFRGKLIHRNAQGQENLGQHLANNLDFAIATGKAERIDDETYGIPGTYNYDNWSLITYNPTTRQYKETSMLANDALRKIAYREYDKRKGVPTNKVGGIIRLQYGGFVEDDSAYNAYKEQIARKRKEREQAEADSKGITVEEQQKASRTPGSITSGDWTGEDYTRLGSIVADIGSMTAAYLPVYGTAASAALGYGSSVANYVADLSENGFRKKDLGNLALNLGLDTIGLIPGLGSAAKGSKMLKTAAKYIPRALSLLAVYNYTGPAISSMKKALSPDAKLTVDDWKNIAEGFKLLLQGGKGLKRTVQARNLRKDLATGNSVLTTSGGKEVSVTPSELSEIRSHRKIEDQQLALRKLKGDDTLELTGDLNKRWFNPLRYLPNSNIRNEYDFNKTVKKRTSQGIIEVPRVYSKSDKYIVANMQRNTPQIPGFDALEVKYNDWKYGVKKPKSKVEPKLEPKVVDEVIDVASMFKPKPLGLPTSDQIHRVFYMGDGKSRVHKSPKDVTNPSKFRKPGTYTDIAVPVGGTPVEAPDANALRAQVKTVNAINSILEPFVSKPKSTPVAQKAKPKQLDLFGEDTGNLVQGVTKKTRKRKEIFQPAVEQEYNQLREPTKKPTRSKKEPAKSRKKSTSEDITKKAEGGVVQFLQDGKAVGRIKAKDMSGWNRTQALANYNWIPDIDRWKSQYEGPDDADESYMLAFNSGEDLYDQLTAKTGDYFGGRYNYSIQDPLAKYRQITFRGTNQGFDDLIRNGIIGYGTTEGNSGFDIYAGDRTGNRTLSRGLSKEDVSRFNKQLATRGMELYDKGNGSYRLRRLQQNPNRLLGSGSNTTSNSPDTSGKSNTANTDNTSNGANSKITGSGLKNGNVNGFNLSVMPEDILALGRLVGGLSANNRAAKIYKEGLKPTLLDTFENIIPLQGNFQAVTNAEQQAGNLESMASRPRTSDASLQLAGELDASDRAGQARFQGGLQDAESFYRTRMLGQQESDAAKARRVDVANRNRASMNQIEAAKKQIDSARITSNYQNNIAPYLAGIENQYAQKRAINQQLDMEEAQRYAERIYSPQFDRLTEDFNTARKAYGVANKEDYTGWETSDKYKELINKRKTLNDEMSQFLLGRRRAIMGSPFMFQVTRTPYTSPVYIKAGGKLSAADRERLQSAKDFNKRLLEDNKQFHKDIMESKREHNKLIMSMSSLTSELIKKAMS